MQRKKSNEEPPLAAFIDNDNIFKSIEERYDDPSVDGYDIEETVEYLQDEGDLRIGKVYLNPSDFGRNQALLHKFNMNLIQPFYTDTYQHKSLADTNITWDVSKVYHEHPEIEKFAIVSGDKDFLPVVRELHRAGKDGVLMFVEGSEAKDLRKTAEKIGWNTYDIPVFRRASSRK